MPNLSGYDVDEDIGSGTLNFGTDELTGTRSFTIAGNDGVAFTRALMGVSILVFNMRVWTTEPATWTLSDGTVLYPLSTDIKGIGKLVGDGVNGPIYTHQRVTVNYGYPPLAKFDQDEIGSEEQEYGAEFLSLPKYSLKFEGSGKPIDENLGILLGCTEINISRKELTEHPGTVIRTLRGKLNSGTFRGAPVGTVLFLGASVKEDLLDGSSRRKFDVVFKFKEKEIDWNYAYDKSTSSWDRVVGALSDETVYAYGDFSSLVSVLDRS